MNIAERLIAYYNEEDFKNNYAEVMHYDWDRDKSKVIEKLKEIMFENTSEDFSEEDFKKVNDYLYENFEDLIEDYTGWSTSNIIVSISFGEQEECIKDLIEEDSITDKDREKLITMFEDAGFFINSSNKDYAYYDLSDTGICITCSEEEFKEIVKTGKLEKVEKIYA